MKKLFFLVVAAFFAASYVNAQSAPKVDLQINRVYVQTHFALGAQSVDSLRIAIQNNGPDDFQGQFSIAIKGNNTESLKVFSGKIDFGTAVDIGVISSPGTDSYFIQLDSQEEVEETKEYNNSFYFERNFPQIAITSPIGHIAENLRDTIFVTPGESFHEEFRLLALNYESVIIGVYHKIYNYNNVNSNPTYFSMPGYYNGDGISYSNEWQYQNSGYNEASMTWLADQSNLATHSLHLGSFYGTGNDQLGLQTTVYLSTQVAVKNLWHTGLGLSRAIKVIDRVRGDVTGDGVVDQNDVDVLHNGIIKNFNYWWGVKGMYTKEGLNYGAGRVLFSRPDFLSVALMNIWVNNPNDPLVQGLGIGELMSETVPGSSASSVKPIDNTFSVSENGEVIEVFINAPEADVYNVTAQDENGQMIQRTGKIGEDILLPVGVKNVHVETVKIKNGTTGLFSPKSIGPQISVYPNPITDYVNISSPENGKLSILNLNGQEVYSQPINAQESLTLSTGDWHNGVYLIKIATAAGQTTVKVVK